MTVPTVRALVEAAYTDVVEHGTPARDGALGPRGYRLVFLGTGEAAHVLWAKAVYCTAKEMTVANTVDETTALCVDAFVRTPAHQREEEVDPCAR